MTSAAPIWDKNDRIIHIVRFLCHKLSRLTTVHMFPITNSTVMSIAIDIITLLLSPRTIELLIYFKGRKFRG